MYTVKCILLCCSKTMFKICHYHKYCSAYKLPYYLVQWYKYMYDLVEENEKCQYNSTI